MSDRNGSNVPTTTTAALILSPDKFNIVPYVKEEFVVQITNVSFETVLFRMLTTSPLRYSVTPTKGVIKPNASIRVTVMLNRSRLEEEEVQGGFDDFRVQYCVIGPNDIIDSNCANVPGIIKARKAADKSQVHTKKFRCLLEEYPKSPSKPVRAEHTRASALPSVPTEGTPVPQKRADSSSPHTAASKTHLRELEVSTLAEKNRRELAQKQDSLKNKLMVALLVAVAAVIFGVWSMYA
ncbi:hypothetical protein TraAM80_09041 [Trypanosoma rangeli]|uniref:MSP domain-containing protein n=1 Tax=Trypanosoma rangeli TaxID=5698 RepID=A0A422MXK0_TRYRA|nr:uncharacterized protein TraAM80_09041 [Trypanosoma rangeli]RNE97974.1 hypothetical protein TraAM80_09041 [Trypanosoma rangeli]|eukprot:RNE97974.1 hypothetical protein TraAM80_09041 [Trypanosoma rangeli]